MKGRDFPLGIGSGQESLGEPIYCVGNQNAKRRHQIQQVALNLYVNAWQAMPSGGELYLKTDNLVLEEEIVHPWALEPGQYVRVSVSDTGVGMNKETLERIFDPFFTTKVLGKGIGLGLSVLHGIVQNHRGVTSVESQVGKGTKFTICLPAVPE